MKTPAYRRLRRTTARPAFAVRLACFRLWANALRVDIALLPGLGSLLL